MSMIATIKLRKLFGLQASLTLFEQSVELIAQDIAKALKLFSHPAITGFKNVKQSHVIIFTADKGLCGSHNNSVYKAIDVLIKANTKNNIVTDVTCIGTRGANYCKRKEYDVYHKTEINERVFNTTSLMQISTKILNRFLDNEIQEIYLIGNYFISTLQQDTITTRLIPFTPPPKKEKGDKSEELNASIEPEPETFIVLASGLYLFYRLKSALFNSYLSEHSARMTAMENATNNSEDLIRHYVTLQNRARQTAITNELIEIISGKEALKG